MASPSLYPRASSRTDLLSYQPIYRLVTHRLFPGMLQVTALLIFLFLGVVGWQSATNETRYTNLTSLIIWVIWWPGLIVLSLFAARAWSLACPIGFVAKHVSRFGLQLRVPKSIRKNKLAIVLGLFLLHSIIVSYHVHHVPQLTTLYLLVLMGYSLAVSLIFEADAFCSTFCPLNGIIGTYAMLSPTELRSADRSTCRACKANACVGVCPRNLYIGTLQSNDACLLCFDCVKACPEHNVSFRLRAPFAGLWQRQNQTLPNALIVVILLGMMIEEVGEEWAAFESVTTAVPNALIRLGVPGSMLGYHWLLAVWLNVLLPLLIVGVAALLARLLARQGSPLLYFRRYALGFVPLIFSLHLAKLGHKFNTKLSLLPYAFKDPAGAKTAAALNSHTLATPAALLTSHTGEGLLILLLLAAGLAGTLLALYRIAHADEPSALPRYSAAPFYATAVSLSAAFALVIVNWFGLAGG